MNGIKIQELSRNAINLFSETSKAFSTSISEVIRQRSKFVPTKFVDEDKKVRIVFVGQYSAIKPKLPIETAIITTNVINLVFIIV